MGGILRFPTRAWWKIILYLSCYVIYTDNYLQSEKQRTNFFSKWITMNGDHIESKRKSSHFRSKSERKYYAFVLKPHEKKFFHAESPLHTCFSFRFTTKIWDFLFRFDQCEIQSVRCILHWRWLSVYYFFLPRRKVNFSSVARLVWGKILYRAVTDRETQMRWKKWQESMIPFIKWQKKWKK